MRTQNLLLNYTDPVSTPPKTAKLWRYMDLAKFMFLVEHSTLFFPLANKMEDKHDGTLAVLAKDGIRIYSDLHTMSRGESRSDANGPEGIRSRYSVSCWHNNDKESAAMWDLYGKRGMSIALQTTFERLKTVVDKSDYYYKYGLVNYPDKQLSGNYLEIDMFFHKRHSFDYEREFRIVVQPEVGSSAFTDMQRRGGYSKPFNLSNIIQAIWVGPFTEDWFENLVRTIVNRYNLGIEVLRSKIDTDPNAE